MKNFLILIAVTIILVPMIIFVADYGKTELAMDIIKNDADASIAAAANYLDLAAFAEGEMVFNDQDCLAYINDALGEKNTFTLYIFDEQFKQRTYTNQTENKSIKEIFPQENFSFPYDFTDKEGKKVKIEEPSMIIVLERPDDYYRLKGFEKNNIIRSAMYVVDTRNVQMEE